MKYWLVSLILEGSNSFENFSAEYLAGIYTSEEEANEAIQSDRMKSTVRLAIADMGIDGYDADDIVYSFRILGYDFTKDNAIRTSYDCWDL